MSLAVSHFSGVFEGKTVFFQVLKLSNSFYLWIGDERASLSSLCMAADSPYSTTPLSTAVLKGGGERLYGERLAAKLAKRAGCMCYVSVNLPGSVEHALLQHVEGRVVEEMTVNPAAFGLAA